MEEELSKAKIYRRKCRFLAMIAPSAEKQARRLEPDQAAMEARCNHPEYASEEAVLQRLGLPHRQLS